MNTKPLSLLVLFSFSLLMGWGASDLRMAEKLIKSGISAGSKADLRKGVSVAVSDNSKKAARMLLKYASKPKGNADDWPSLYWILLHGVTAFNAEEAAEVVSDFVIKNRRKPIARDLMTALSGHMHSGIVRTMNLVLVKGEDDLQIMAADHLAAVGNVASVEALIKVMKKAKKGSTLLRKCGIALSGITGKSYGESVVNWEGWWKANKEGWKPPLRESASGGTGTILDRLTSSRQGEVDRLRTRKLLVIQAGEKYCCGHSHDYDHIDLIAKKLGIPVDVIDKGDLDDPRKNNVPAFENYCAILVNCTHIRKHCDQLQCPECKPGQQVAGNRMKQCACPKDFHPSREYLMPKRGQRMLKQYLERGGYLFTEDWEMEDFLEKMFPDHVSHGPERPEETVDVLPMPGQSGHPYLRKIFFKPPAEGKKGTITEADLEEREHQWKIDKSTRTVKIKDPNRVTVLLTSPDLKKSADGHHAVAITFAVGGKDGRRPVATKSGEFQQDRAVMDGGRVLYVLSHFGKQGDEEDEFALQNLLLNFLIEASERWKKAPGK